MKTLQLIALLFSVTLAGCACPQADLSTPEGSIAPPPLKLVRPFPGTAEITLGGKRYRGEWSDTRCLTMQCRGEFSNVQKYHRRHVRRGSAVLLADDGARLNCEWVSHDEQVIGTCQTEEGRKFGLIGFDR